MRCSAFKKWVPTGKFSGYSGAAMPHPKIAQFRAALEEFMIRFLALLLLCPLAYAQGPSLTSARQAPLPDIHEVNTPDTSNLLKAFPDLLPTPKGKATLIGGTISKLDNVRDQLTIRVFGGRDMGLLFDGRTHVYRDGASVSVNDLKKGDKVYADTLLAGNDVFAKNIRVVDGTSTGQSSGQIVSYEPMTGELLVRDALAAEPISLHITRNTQITQNHQTVSVADLRPGSLVTINFDNSTNGTNIAQSVSVLAIPGSAFTFVGRIIHLDIHSNLLVLLDPRDNKSYEIYFDPRVAGISKDLREGTELTVTTSFDGARYIAKSYTVMQAKN